MNVGNEVLADTSFKGKIKRYFTDKPKGDFWKWAFITLFVFRYVFYPGILFIAFLNIGLLAPDLSEESMDIVFENASNKIAETFTTVFQMLFELGQSISQNNPTIGMALSFILSNFVYVFWVAMIFLVINLFRYFISWAIGRRKIYRIKRSRKKSGDTNGTG